MRARQATLNDADAISVIYNEGIADRTATFETRARNAEEVRAWFDGTHPIVVVEEDDAVAAFASTASYRSRECYAGIAEASVYVARPGCGTNGSGGAYRKCGASRLLKTALARLPRESGEPAVDPVLGFPRGRDL